MRRCYSFVLQKIRVFSSWPVPLGPVFLLSGMLVQIRNRCGGQFRHDEIASFVLCIQNLKLGALIVKSVQKNFSPLLNWVVRLDLYLTFHAGLFWHSVP
jgi:hypothetical protein